MGKDGGGEAEGGKGAVEEEQRAQAGLGMVGTGLGGAQLGRSGYLPAGTNVLTARREFITLHCSTRAKAGWQLKQSGHSERERRRATGNATLLLARALDKQRTGQTGVPPGAW